jgi:hypothetical protein
MTRVAASAEATMAAPIAIEHVFTPVEVRQILRYILSIKNARDLVDDSLRRWRVSLLSPPLWVQQVRVPKKNPDRSQDTVLGDRPHLWAALTATLCG